jgi:hypothetical protein
MGLMDSYYSNRDFYAKGSRKPTSVETVIQEQERLLRERNELIRQLQDEIFELTILADKKPKGKDEGNGER